MIVLYNCLLFDNDLLTRSKDIMFDLILKTPISSMIRCFSFLNDSKSLIIDSIEENKETGYLLIIIRFFGKSTPPIKKDPYKLLIEGGNKFSECFSEEDFKKIIDSMLENQRRCVERKYRKIFRLIRHQTPSDGDVLIVYQNIDTGQYHINRIIDVFSDKDLMLKFSSEDILCIYNLADILNTQEPMKYILLSTQAQAL